MAAEAAHILKKKGCILSLEKFLDKKIVVILVDEFEIRGILKGFDNNVSLLLADAEIWNSNEGKPYRRIGTTVVRGRSIVEVMSNDTSVLANNPFT